MLHLKSFKETPYVYFASVTGLQIWMIIIRYSFIFLNRFPPSFLKSKKNMIFIKIKKIGCSSSIEKSKNPVCFEKNKQKTHETFSQKIFPYR